MSPAKVDRTFVCVCTNSGIREQNSKVLSCMCSEDTKIGGASAGSLIAATYHSGIGSKAATEACLTLAAELRKNGTRGRLKVLLTHSSHHAQVSNQPVCYVLLQSVPLHQRCVTSMALLCECDGSSAASRCLDAHSPNAALLTMHHMCTSALLQPVLHPSYIIYV